VIRAVRRAKLFVFLRGHRHELFDKAFQAELARAYADSPKGRPPAQLALATILQAYAKVSDDEVIEATVMDRRWQLALDCLGARRRAARGAGRSLRGCTAGTRGWWPTARPVDGPC
jgi:transposase